MRLREGLVARVLDSSSRLGGLGQCINSPKLMHQGLDTHHQYLIHDLSFHECLIHDLSSHEYLIHDLSSHEYLIRDLSSHEYPTGILLMTRFQTSLCDSSGKKHGGGNWHRTPLPSHLQQIQYICASTVMPWQSSVVIDIVWITMRGHRTMYSDQNPDPME